MKKAAFWLIVVLFSYAMPLAPGTIEKTMAGARGCCMQQGSNGRWYRNGMRFNQCHSANRSQDGNDDLYSKSGRFWWDKNC